MRIGLRAGLIIAPLCGGIALMATLDPTVAVLATLVGGAATALFFAGADHLGRR